MCCNMPVRVVVGQSDSPGAEGITLFCGSNYFPLSNFLHIILHLAVETVKSTRGCGDSWDGGG